MNHQSNPPTPDASANNERVKTAVRAHRIKLRILTTAAFGCGIIAIAASIYIAWNWVIFLPVQRQLLHDTPKFNYFARPANESAEDGIKRIDKTLRYQAAMAYVASTQATGAALAVGVLGLGTLMMLTVVVLNRRVTLNQINVNLTQISNQLRELQVGRGGT